MHCQVFSIMLLNIIASRHRVRYTNIHIIANRHFPCATDLYALLKPVVPLLSPTFGRPYLRTCVLSPRTYTMVGLPLFWRCCLSGPNVSLGADDWTLGVARHFALLKAGACVLQSARFFRSRALTPTKPATASLQSLLPSCGPVVAFPVDNPRLPTSALRGFAFGNCTEITSAWLDLPTRPHRANQELGRQLAVALVPVQASSLPRMRGAKP